MFIDKLIESIKAKKSPVLVGLDPRIEKTPQFIKDVAFKRKGENIEGISEALYLLIKV